MIGGLVLAGSAAASEGTAELSNVIGDEARCWVASILTQGYTYKLLVSCRDLTYPASGEEVFNYILWVVPADGTAPQKLGPLGVGKAEFGTATRFGSLFVSKEGGKKKTLLGKQEVGEVVMRGEMAPVIFLDTGMATQPTRSPTAAPTAGAGATERVAQSVKVGSTILRIVVVAFLLGIGAIVVVILVSSLGKGKNIPPGL